MEIFGAISAAEAEAKKIRQEAERGAVLDRENAVKDGEAAVESARAKAAAETETSIKNAVAAAEREAVDLVTNTGNRKAVLRERIAKRFDSAVDFIVDSVVSG